MFAFSSACVRNLETGKGGPIIKIQYNVAESPDLLLFAVIKGCETKGVGWSDYACTATWALCIVHSHIKFTNSDYKPPGNKMNVNIQHVVTTRERSFPALTDNRVALHVRILIKF